LFGPAAWIGVAAGIGVAEAGAASGGATPGARTGSRWVEIVGVVLAGCADGSRQVALAGGAWPADDEDHDEDGDSDSSHIGTAGR